jgi:hypothetical protein
MKVLRAVWLPGFGSALSSVGFGAMIAFSSLLSAERGWSPLWLGMGLCSETLHPGYRRRAPPPATQTPPRRLSLIGAATITEAAYLG